MSSPEKLNTKQGLHRGVQAMPRSNFRLALGPVFAYKPNPHVAVVPEGSCIHMRTSPSSAVAEQHLATAEAKARTRTPKNPRKAAADRKDRAARFAADVRQFQVANWESFGDLSLGTKGVLMTLQNSLKRGNIQETFKLVQQEKKTCLGAQKELKENRKGLSQPVSAAYVLLSLLVAAPDANACCDALAKTGFDPEDPRLEAEKKQRLPEADQEQTAAPRNRQSQLKLEKLSEQARKNCEWGLSATLPKACPEEAKKLQELAERKTWKLTFNNCFPKGAPVASVAIAEDGKPSHIRFREGPFGLGRKTVKIDWSDGKPVLGKGKPKALQDEKRRKAILEKLVPPSTSPERPGRAADKASRSFNALALATRLLEKVVPGQLGNTFFRRDVQFMKYELADSAQFQAAYLQETSDVFMKAKLDAQCVDYLPGLVVEAARDLQSIMVGTVKRKDMLGLIQLFPPSPENVGELAAKGYPALSDVQKVEIRNELKKVFGDSQALVHAFCKQLKLFDDAVAEASGQANKWDTLPTGYWNLQAALFGFDSVGLRKELQALDGNETFKEWSSKVKTFCFYIFGNPDVLFASED